MSGPTREEYLASWPTITLVIEEDGQPGVMAVRVCPTCLALVTDPAPHEDEHIRCVRGRM